MTSASTGITTGTKRGGYSAAAGWLAVAIILAWSSVCAAGVLNPSFETYYMGLPWPRQLPQNWYHADHPSFNSYCTNTWSTEGGLSAGLFSRLGKPVSAGNYENFYQFVDFTGIGSIVFDVRLVALPAGAFEHFQASLLVDGATLWSRNASGIYTNQQVNVGKMAGWHRIEMRLSALDTGQFPLAYWTQWDNLRLVEGPKTIKAEVTLDPNTLNLASNGNWITCYIELPEEYEPNEIDGATVKLGEIPACMGNQGWAVPGSNEENTMDYDADGTVERMVKFDRSAVQAAVQAPEATVTVTGKLIGGTPFEGTAVIRVIDNKAPKSK
jgi:hypothetical protein